MFHEYTRNSLSISIVLPLAPFLSLLNLEFVEPGSKEYSAFIQPFWEFLGNQRGSESAFVTDMSTTVSPCLYKTEASAVGVMSNFPSISLNSSLFLSLIILVPAMFAVCFGTRF